MMVDWVSHVGRTVVTVYRVCVCVCVCVRAAAASRTWKITWRTRTVCRRSGTHCVPTTPSHARSLLPLSRPTCARTDSPTFSRVRTISQSHSTAAAAAATTTNTTTSGYYHHSFTAIMQENLFQLTLLAPPVNNRSKGLLPACPRGWQLVQLSVFGQLWSWRIHLENISYRSVGLKDRVERDEWITTDMTDCITFPANAVGRRLQCFWIA